MNTERPRDVSELDDVTIDRIYSVAKSLGPPILLATGTQSGDGVTTVVSALSQSLAARDKNCLLVDANLQRPDLHNRFGVPLSPGMVQILNEDCPLADAVHSVSEGFEGDDALSLIPAGSIPRNPLGLWELPATADFLAECQQRFEFTVIDAPCLDVSLAALRLAPLVGGVMLVLRAGRTRRQAARKMYDRFIEANANVVGTILNEYRDFVPACIRRTL